MTTPGLPTIRRARPDDAEALSALARRSKAHWGYADDFLARVGPDLTITVEDIEGMRVALDDRDRIERSPAPAGSRPAGR